MEPTWPLEETQTWTLDDTFMDPNDLHAMDKFLGQTMRANPPSQFNIPDAPTDDLISSSPPTQTFVVGSSQETDSEEVSLDGDTPMAGSLWTKEDVSLYGHPSWTGRDDLLWLDALFNTPWFGELSWIVDLFMNLDGPIDEDEPMLQYAPTSVNVSLPEHVGTNEVATTSDHMNPNTSPILDSQAQASGRTSPPRPTTPNSAIPAESLHARSCEECLRRKAKCNGSFPWERCKDFSSQCVFPAESGRAPNPKSDTLSSKPTYKAACKRCAKNKLLECDKVPCSRCCKQLIRCVPREASGPASRSPRADLKHDENGGSQRPLKRKRAHPSYGTDGPLGTEPQVDIGTSFNTNETSGGHARRFVTPNSNLTSANASSSIHSQAPRSSTPLRKTTLHNAAPTPAGLMHLDYSAELVNALMGELEENPMQMPNGQRATTVNTDYSSHMGEPSPYTTMLPNAPREDSSWMQPGMGAPPSHTIEYGLRGHNPPAEYDLSSFATMPQRMSRLIRQLPNHSASSQGTYQEHSLQAPHLQYDVPEPQNSTWHDLLDTCIVCNACLGLFSSRRSIADHLMDVFLDKYGKDFDVAQHHTTPTYLCDNSICPTSFLSNEERDLHMTIVHPGYEPRAYFCTINGCPKSWNTFSSRATLDRHLYELHDLECIERRALTSQSVSNTSDMRALQPIQRELDDLGSHGDSEESNLRDSKNRSLCNACRAPFKSRRGLLSHLDRLHEINDAKHLLRRTYVCGHQNCDGAFSSNEARDRHQTAEGQHSAGSKPFRHYCPVDGCPRGWNALFGKQTLEVHLEKVHKDWHGWNPYKFPNSNRPERSLQAPQTATRVPEPDTTADHKRSLQAPQTATRVPEPDTTADQAKATLSDSPKPWFCYACDYPYNTGQALNNHMSKECSMGDKNHLDNRSYVCQHMGCRATFSTRGARDRHENTEGLHLEHRRPYDTYCMIDDCPRSWNALASKRNLAQHYSVVHKRPDLAKASLKGEELEQEKTGFVDGQVGESYILFE